MGGEPGAGGGPRPALRGERRGVAGGGRRGLRRDPGGGRPGGGAGSGGARLRRRDRRLAGFGETEAGRELEAELREAALATGLPVCGPNGNGVVAVAARAPLWGDSVELPAAGPVALVTQAATSASTRSARGAGSASTPWSRPATRRCSRASDWIEAICELDGSARSPSSSGRRRWRAAGAGARPLRRAGIGVAALKVGSSEAGARAAGAHTGALAGDQRVFAALLAEAGAALPSDPGELLELVAGAGPAPRSRPRRDGGLAVLTCSGGDSGSPPTSPPSGGVELPELAAPTRERLAALLPAAATIGQPARLHLDVVGPAAGCWSRSPRGSGRTPRSTSCCCSSTNPTGSRPTSRAEWEGVRAALSAGAGRSGADGAAGLDAAGAARAPRRRRAGGARGRHLPPASARRSPAPPRWDPSPPTRRAWTRSPPARRRAMGPFRASDRPGRGRGVKRPGARPTPSEPPACAKPGSGPDRPRGTDTAGAVDAARELGCPVALKLSSADPPSTTARPAPWPSELGDEELVRAAAGVAAAAARGGRRDPAGRADGRHRRRRRAALRRPPRRRRAGARRRPGRGLGGGARRRRDVPLPASPARVERALRSLRAAPLLLAARGGTRRTSPPPPSRRHRRNILLEHRLALLEINPALLTLTAAASPSTPSPAETAQQGRTVPPLWVERKRGRPL